MRVILPLAFSFILVGCSSKLELKPDNGSNLDVTFRSGGGEGGFISIYQDDYDCFGISLAGTKSSEMPIEKVINSNGRAYLSINSSYYRLTQYCNANYTFPISGYKKIRLTISNDEKICSTSVEGYDDLHADWVNISLSRRNFMQPRADSQGPYCSPENTYRGSSSLMEPRGFAK